LPFETFLKCGKIFAANLLVKLQKLIKHYLNEFDNCIHMQFPAKVKKLKSKVHHRKPVDCYYFALISIQVY